MIKKGLAKFCVSFTKACKEGLLTFGKEAKSPAKVKCCDVCCNDGILCHAVCKYRSATYQEYLKEKFELGEALVKGIEKGLKEGAKYAKNIEHIKACKNNFDSMPGNKKQ